MEWVINICVEKIYNNDEATVLSKIVHDFDGVQAVKSFTVQNWVTSQLFKFVVVAEEMPIAKKLHSALKADFLVSQVNVTRYCWEDKSDVTFQWRNSGITVYSDESTFHDDTWDFCVEGISVLSVHYIPTYTKGWSPREYQKYFKNETFCLINTSGKLTTLKATKIETALQEAEDIYLQNTKEILKEFEQKVETLKNSIVAFNEWKEK